ncbi:MAG: glycosyltransferase family 4 protein [Acidobacteria bacterium]|nr:glycosyltransferase family 4 protein [Acidobacteriota bacterium]
MRIGLNLLYLIPSVNEGGTAVYARGLIQALAAIDRSNQYFIFLNHESAGLELTDAVNFRHIVCPIRATRRAMRYCWEQFVLPVQCLWYKIDLLHSLGYVGPLWCHCVKILTVPDANFVAHGNLMMRGKRAVLGSFVRQAAHRADKVITISEFSRSELSRELGIPRCAIEVVHLGPGWDLTQERSSPWSELREKYGLPERYVVAFGAVSPHKNIARLAAAFEQACHDLPHALVIIGNLPKDLEPLSRVVGPAFQHRVLALGYVSSSELLPILSNAELFVLPSLYEGFGLPLLEAQQAGVAVACSTAGSLPEVAGSSAIFFDPYSISSIADAIRRGLCDSGLRRSLQELGQENLKRFTWAKTARETLAIYETVQRVPDDSPGMAFPA